MRTTVALDPDVVQLLRNSMQKRGMSFKAVRDDALRKGLTGARPAKGRRFMQKTFALGAIGRLRWDKALAVADAIEDEQTVRNLRLRR